MTDGIESEDWFEILCYHSSVLSEKIREENNDKVKENLIRSYLESIDKEKSKKTVPDFKEDLDWFNVTEPLTFTKSLKGKIVVLDFFTYCCINCMHILPDLKRLEDLYSIEDGLVVIGVHSPKFDNEKDSINVISAIQRYNITHPVVNDSQSTMWINLKVRCWPTIIIIGPYGNPLFILMGEGHYDLLKKYIGTTIEYYKEKQIMSNASLPINVSTNDIIASNFNLKFPGKIVCYSKYDSDDDDEDTAKKELYAISDSGNHRILIINSHCDVLYKIGGKTSGFVDGDFETVRFNSPQGVAFLNDYIVFVADTENHAIRRINLKAKQVETVVGNGIQGNNRSGGKIGKLQEISSPWDVICYKAKDINITSTIDGSNNDNKSSYKDVVLIAMAGTHQIWALFLDDIIWWKSRQFSAMTCASIVGSGREENRNNSYPQNASFAQPSGLALDKKEKILYIADSESSCIRKVLLEDGGKVLAVSGGDRNPSNLFAFGDVDGSPSIAKFQHPLGVTFSLIENIIYVADTYNHKIKQINTKTNDTKSCKIYDMNGELYNFNEPGGLCLNPTGDYLFVADTNNHTIEKVNLKTMKTSSLKLNFNNVTEAANLSKQEIDFTLKLPEIIAELDTEIIVKLLVTLKLNYIDVKLTENAPQKWNIKLPNEFHQQQQNGNIDKSGKFEIQFKIPKLNGAISSDQILIVTILNKLNLCSKGACFSKIYAIEIPVEFKQNGLKNIVKYINVIVTQNDIQNAD